MKPSQLNRKTRNYNHSMLILRSILTIQFFTIQFLLFNFNHSFFYHSIFTIQFLTIQFLTIPFLLFNFLTIQFCIESHSGPGPNPIFVNFCSDMQKLVIRHNLFSGNPMPSAWAREEHGRENLTLLD